MQILPHPHKIIELFTMDGRDSKLMWGIQSSEAQHLRRYIGMAEVLSDLIHLAESAVGQDPKLATVIAQVRAIREPDVTTLGTLKIVPRCAGNYASILYI